MIDIEVVAMLINITGKTLPIYFYSENTRERKWQNRIFMITRRFTQDIKD